MKAARKIMLYAFTVIVVFLILILADVMIATFRGVS